MHEHRLTTLDWMHACHVIVNCICIFLHFDTERSLCFSTLCVDDSVKVGPTSVKPPLQLEASCSPNCSWLGCGRILKATTLVPLALEPCTEHSSHLVRNHFIIIALAPITNPSPSLSVFHPLNQSPTNALMTSAIVKAPQLDSYGNETSRLLSCHTFS
jgi:hypothetical protein